uniref:HMG box domain-containing protein n=1 Tax=Steinernema glaseri TaxID=37863 RepID=A0A1I7Z5M5_9BILA
MFRVFQKKDLQANVPKWSPRIEAGNPYTALVFSRAAELWRRYPLQDRKAYKERSQMVSSNQVDHMYFEVLDPRKPHGNIPFLFKPSLSKSVLTRDAGYIKGQTAYICTRCKSIDTRPAKPRRYLVAASAATNPINARALPATRAHGYGTAAADAALVGGEGAQAEEMGGISLGVDKRDLTTKRVKITCALKCCFATPPRIGEERASRKLSASWSPLPQRSAWTESLDLLLGPLKSLVLSLLGKAMVLEQCCQDCGL